MRISDWSSDVCSSDLINVCSLSSKINPNTGIYARYRSSRKATGARSATPAWLLPRHQRAFAPNPSHLSGTERPLCRRHTLVCGPCQTLEAAQVAAPHLGHIVLATHIIVSARHSLVAKIGIVQHTPHAGRQRIVIAGAAQHAPVVGQAFL